MIARMQELVWTVVSSNPLLERLVTASIDVVVVTAVVAAIVALARIRSRRVIALLWLVALAKPVVSLVAGTPAPLIPIRHAVAPETTAAIETPAPARGFEFVVTQDSGRAVVRTVDEHSVAPAAGGTMDHGGASPGSATAAGWIAGVVIMLVVGLIDRMRLRRLVARSSPAGEAITARVQRIASGFRRGRAPRARVTAELESPALAGTLRPVILLPEWIVGRGHEERLEWALRHELAHWSSRDHLANVTCEVARALFFFHPVVWWAARRWKEAMEMACDQTVVTSRREVKRYAEQLYQILAHVDERRRLPLPTSLFATRTQIGRRIETLLRSRGPLTRPGMTAIALVCVFAATSFAVGTTVKPRAPRAARVPVVVAESAAPAAPVAIEEDMVAASGTASYDDLDVNTVDDDHELRLRAEYIEFDRATGRIIHLGEGGFLHVWERDGDTERRLRVTPGDDGGLRYRYTVDGHGADFDDAAQTWFSGILRHHLTRLRNYGNLVSLPAPPDAPLLTVPEPAPVPMVAPVRVFRLKAPRPAPLRVFRLRAPHVELPSPPMGPEATPAPAPVPKPKPKPRGERI